MNRHRRPSPVAYAIITTLTIVALHHATSTSSWKVLASNENNRVWTTPHSGFRLHHDMRTPPLMFRKRCHLNAAFCSSSCFCGNVGTAGTATRKRKRPLVLAARQIQVDSDDDELPYEYDKGIDNSLISDRVRVRVKDLVGEDGRSQRSGGSLKLKEGSDQESNNDPKTSIEGGKARLARAAASLIAKRKKQGFQYKDHQKLSFSPSASAKKQMYKRSPYADRVENYTSGEDDDKNDSPSYDLMDLTKKIDQKILANNWNRSGQRRPRVNDKTPGTEVHVQHETDSMQSLLGYNHVEGEWSDRNSTTYHVAIVFGKPLIRDQVTIEYATRLRTLAKMLKDEPSFHPSLICFTGGVSGENSISDAAAGYVYFRHLCGSQNIMIDDLHTKFWVDGKSTNEREAMEGIAQELWRNNIKQWLKDRPLTERLNQHYGVGWTILDCKVDIHFTLVSTEYHLCNLNDVHHRSPGKSFLQPLVSLRGLVGSDRWVVNEDELEVMDPNYSSSVHVRNGNSMPVVSDRANFGGVENSVDTSWSFQYGTFPFLHGDEDAVVFLGQCFLLGEELTPLLVNMKGVVEQTEFFQRDNYLLLTSIRRSLVSLVEALYTDKGQEIRAGVIKYFEESHRRFRNRFTKEDVKIIVVLESALLNLGRCIDLVKPAGLLVSSVPAATWSKALFNLEESMSRIKTVCDPDQPLEMSRWGKLVDDAPFTSDENE